MFDFRYELGEWGWANSHFKWDGGSLDFRTSYLSSPLIDLARQVRWLVDPRFRLYNEKPEPVDFTDEPGHLRLTLAESSIDQLTEGSLDELGHMLLTLKLEEWDDIWPGSGEPADRLHMTVQMPVSDYARLAFRELNDIWAEFGMLGYRRSWLHSDFPVADFAAIGQQLRIRKDDFPLWGPLDQVWVPPPFAKDGEV